MMSCTNNVAVPELNIQISTEDNSEKKAQMLAGFFQVLTYTQFLEKKSVPYLGV